jgi:hypothetical protein
LTARARVDSDFTAFVAFGIEREGEMTGLAVKFEIGSLERDEGLE